MKIHQPRSILSWTSAGLRSLDSHIDYLESKSGNKHVSAAVGHSSYKPHLIVENDILKLVNSKGFGRFFVKLDDVSISDLESSLSTQKEFMSKRKTLNFDYSRMINSAARVSSVFSSKFSTPLSPMTAPVAAENLNMQASAGYPYYQKKGKVKDSLLSDYHTTDLSELRLYPTMVAFRISLARDKSGITKKVRCIYPYPGVVTLHELRFIIPFMDEVLKHNDTFYATGLTGQMISDRITNIGSKFNFSFSSDISKFDLNMPIELIQASFSVIRSCFKLDRADSEKFEFLRDYFCSSYFCSRVGSAEGSSYIKRSGIPSGSGFTNLLGTIAHAIMLEYYSENFLNDNYCNICSDDNLVFTNKRFNINDISDIYSPWGMEPNRDECDFYDGTDSLFFLGFRWVKG